MDAPRRPRLRAVCALLHAERAPRREISTSIYPKQPDQLPGTKASSSNPLIRAGQMPPSPRGAGVHPQVQLPSAAHPWLRTFCRKALQQDGFVPVSPVCCTPRADANPSAACPVICGCSKSGAGAQERQVWGALGCSLHSLFGTMWEKRDGAHPAPHTQPEQPFAACRSPVVCS